MNTFNRFALSAILSLTALSPAFAGGSTPPNNPPPPSTGLPSEPTGGIYAATPTAGQDEVIFAAGNNTVTSYDTTTGVSNSITVEGAGTTATSLNGTVYVASQNAADTEITVSAYSPSLQVINSNVATFANTLNSGTDSTSGGLPSIYVNGNNLYLANQGWTNTILQTVNLQTGALTTLANQPSPIGDNYNIVVATPNGASAPVIFASGYQSGHIEEYDATDGSLINDNFANIEPNGAGWGGYMTAQGNTLYVDDYYTGVVDAFDMTTGDEVATNLVDQFNFDQLTDHDAEFVVGPLAALGNDLFVTEGSTTYKYDTTTGDQEDEIDGFGGQAGVSAEYVSPTDLAAAPEPRSWAMGTIMLSAAGLLLARRRQEDAI